MKRPKRTTTTQQHKIQSTWYKGNFLKFFSKSSIWYITFKCLLKYKNHLYSYLYFIQTFSPAKFTTPQHIRPELKTVCVTADGYRYCVRCAVFRSPRRNYNATQRKERRRRKKWATPTKDDQETRYQCSLILSECVRFFFFSVNFSISFISWRSDKPETGEKRNLFV